MQAKGQPVGVMNKTERLNPKLNALADALTLQDRALSELTDLTERQGIVIGGVSLVLRALVDVLLDQEQRAMLDAHLEMTTAGDWVGARSSVVEALLD
jgi:hypothetical protein